MKNNPIYISSKANDNCLPDDIDKASAKKMSCNY